MKNVSVVYGEGGVEAVELKSPDVSKLRLTEEQHRAVAYIVELRVDGLVGKVMGSIEMLGLPSLQMSAAKQQVKSIIWDTYNSVVEDLASHLDDKVIRERATEDAAINRELPNMLVDIEELPAEVQEQLKQE